MKHHGLTDPLILVGMLEHHGVAKQQAMSKLKELEAAMTGHFEAHAADAGVGLEILPGVSELLQALHVSSFSMHAALAAVPCCSLAVYQPAGPPGRLVWAGDR